MISQKEIAEQLGLSRATVSRALRGDPNLRIGDDTKNRILKLASDKGYSLKTKQNPSFHKILIVHKDSHFMSQIDNAYYFAIRNGIEETCHEKKLNFNYLTISKLNQFETHVNLIIIVGNHTQHDQERILNHPSFKDANFILIGKTNFFPDSFHWVSYSIKRATEIAVNSITNRAYDHYYYLGTEESYGVNKKHLELAHYQKALLEINKEFTAIHEGDFGTEGGYRSMASLANENILKNACIMCQNDPVAIGALQYMNDQNIEVPSDVSIVSLNGDQNSQFIYPRLTTVDLNARIMGKEAIYLALRLLNNDLSKVCKIEIQPALIKGQSS